MPLPVQEVPFPQPQLADAEVASPAIALRDRLLEPGNNAFHASLHPCCHQSTLAATSTKVAFRPTV